MARSSWRWRTPRTTTRSRGCRWPRGSRSSRGERDILEGLEAAYSNGASEGNGAGDESLGDIEYLSDDEEDVNHLRDLASEAPVIRLVNQLINRALEQRASDIHIEPFEHELKVRYRIDGVLHDVDT